MQAESAGALDMSATVTFPQDSLFTAKKNAAELSATGFTTFLIAEIRTIRSHIGIHLSNDLSMIAALVETCLADAERLD